MRGRRPADRFWKPTIRDGLPPLAENVEAELDRGDWPKDIAGRRALSVGTLRELLVAGGHTALAKRLAARDDRP